LNVALGKADEVNTILKLAEQEFTRLKNQQNVKHQLHQNGALPGSATVEQQLQEYSANQKY